MTPDPAVDGTNLPALSARQVSVVFGHPSARALATALAAMDEGLGRAAVKEASGLTFGVHDCSFSVAAGEIVVLMGLSGSGKSTLLRTVNGLTAINRGEVQVHDGRRMCDVSRCPPGELRRLRTTQVAMVFQQFALLPWRTVADNVALGLELAGVPEEQRMEKVGECLSLVGLEDWNACRIDELSGGMQQRVGLARALATDAPVLLMDEPFSALDPLTRSALQDELLILREKLGKSILFVTHDLREALKIGDRIVILQEGRVVQSADPKTVILQPASREIAEFAANIDPVQVLCARDIMRPAGGDAHPEALDATTPVATLIRLFVERRTDLAISSAGRIVGQVGERELLQAMDRPRR